MTASPDTFSTISLFGIRIAQMTIDKTVATLLDWMQQPGPCRYVVTPNLNHVVLLRSDAALQAAYDLAALAVADGWPLVTASRWFGSPLPERVAGSDVVPRLFAEGEQFPGLRVFLLGAGPGVAERARTRIHSQWPHVQVCDCYSPPQGFENDPEENEAIVARINRAAPHLLVVGLGAPRQEIWLQCHSARLLAPVAIAAGATIDFLADEQRRAPLWIQRLNLEWLFRVLSNPKRLAGRYLHDTAAFPFLMIVELIRTLKASSASDNRDAYLES
jgi:N-acetylglucosaminyldiphosphoundecaprenol N-acetyl-beta-D-mannosaminyltransferase